jgi:hypothetical protein
MENLGMGVMLGILGGNEETVNSIKSSLNKVIETVTLDEENLVISFTDNTQLTIWDDGQSCCEARYMTTDDNLSDFNGATLLDFELKSVESGDDDGWEEHEIQFLDVKTSNGVFTMANHNVHNGYYGGFYVKAKLN